MSYLTYSQIQLFNSHLEFLYSNIEANPDSMALKKLLISTYLQEGHYGVASYYSQNLLSLHPTDVELMLLVARSRDANTHQ